MVRFAQFSTKSLFRTIAIWSVLLAIVSGIVRWQMKSVQLAHANRVLNLHGGTYTSLSALEFDRMKRAGWEKKWSDNSRPLVGRSGVAIRLRC